MNKLILAISSLIIFICFTSGCKKDDTEDQLKQDFRGKYSIVSATSDKEIDVNVDGSSNTDLLKEMDLLRQSYLELIIPENSIEFVYSQFWQNQSLENGGDTIPNEYDPNILVHYVNQATVASFTFNEDKSKLVLSRDHPDPSFPLPKVVEILPDHNIKVVMDKNIYTKSGWEEVSITVIYKRFTDQF